MICSIAAGVGTAARRAPRGDGYADDDYRDSGAGEPRDLRRRQAPSRRSGPRGRRGRRGRPPGRHAYENLGRVYDYYYDTFGWDSYDGKGSPVVGVVNSCDAAPPPTGATTASTSPPGAGDAPGHRGARVHPRRDRQHRRPEYECQSGALNESITDIMALNLDPEDPTYGEDRNGDGPDDPDGGTIRDYRWPERFGQPMSADDYRATPNDRFGDWGGVHTNSGIPNHAYYQLVLRVGREDRRADRLARPDRAPATRLRVRGLPHRAAESAEELFGRGSEGRRRRRRLRRRRPRRHLARTRAGGLLSDAPASRT